VATWPHDSGPESSRRRHIPGLDSEAVPSFGEDSRDRVIGGGQNVSAEVLSPPAGFLGLARVWWAGAGPAHGADPGFVGRAGFSEVALFASVVWVAIGAGVSQTPPHRRGATGIAAFVAGTCRLLEGPADLLADELGAIEWGWSP